MYVLPEPISRSRRSDAELLTNLLPIVPQCAHPDYGTTSLTQVRKQFSKIDAPVYLVGPIGNCGAFIDIRCGAYRLYSPQSGSPTPEFLAHACVLQDGKIIERCANDHEPQRDRGDGVEPEPQYDEIERAMDGAV